MQAAEQTSYGRGASKNKYVVYSQVNRMPLFALEQIVLLSFAVREERVPVSACVSFSLVSLYTTEPRRLCESLEEKTVYQQAGEQERVKRKKENTREVNHPLCCPRFFRYVLLLVLLDASSCTRIPTLIVGNKMMAVRTIPIQCLTN